MESPIEYNEERLKIQMGLVVSADSWPVGRVMILSCPSTV